MTTIAWDGEILAGDTLRVIGGGMAIHGPKVFRLDTGELYGGSGEYQYVLAVLAWIKAGMPEKDKPSIGDDFSALYVTAQQQVFRIEDRLILMPVQEQYHAVGSGRDFAIAAMALGKNAIEAVELAAQFDVYTGGEVMRVCSNRSRYA